MSDSPTRSQLFEKSKKSVPVIISMCLLFVMICFSLFPSIAAFYNPWDLKNTRLEDSMKPPSWMNKGDSRFLLGTDMVGRDVWSIIIYGTRPSIVVGFSVVLISAAIGVFLGTIAGFYGGVIGNIIMRIADAVYAFPALLIAIFLMAIFKRRGIDLVIVALSAISWVQYSRIMFSMVMSKKEEAFVLAAKALGAGNIRTITTHILPNCISPCIVVAFLDIARVVMLEASLSFLGLGSSYTEPSLGQIIAGGKDVLMAGVWWVTVFPALFLVLLILSINIVGEWLKALLNPEISETLI